MAMANCSTKNRVPVRAGDKVIGVIEETTFVKPVYGSRHRLRTPSAWAIDAVAFDAQVKPYAKEIIIWDRESGTKYRASVEHFDRQKRSLSRGFGLQYFLVLSEWEVQPGPDAPRQLALDFAGAVL